MADRFYQVPVGGDTKFDVTEAASSSLAFVELGVTYTATGASKLEVLKAIDAIKHYILQDNWPPA